jgi:Tfp pilus assembly protein PilN
MWIIVGTLVAIPLLFFLPIGLRLHRLRQLEAKIQVLEPQKLAADQLQRSLDTLRAQEAAFQRVTKGEDLWAKRLNTLSDVPQDGLWFSELTLDPAKGLIIRGSALEEANPTQLVQDLEADAHFKAAIKEIKIESLKRVQDGEFELTTFTLNCALAEVPK